MNMRKLVALILTVAAAIAALSATPAQAADVAIAPLSAAQAAADPYIWVCNEAGSDDNITAWSDNPYYRISINQGDCKSINDRGGNARVDVDPAGGENDIDSYRWFKGNYPFGGGSWGPCYNNENGAANPFSDGHSTTYRTSKYLNCA